MLGRRELAGGPAGRTLLAALLGVAAFALVTGGRIVDPGYVDWLMAGDPAQAFLGWHFFRHTPWLQFPLGANPDYGMALGSSIVFTDSVPLLAFLFKPVSALLPGTFQYLGIWIALCFVLQAVFAYKLLSLLTPNNWLRLLGSGFFVLAPVLLWRVQGHFALSAQWVLVAGLCLYLSKRFAPVLWIGLLGVTALIHAYLLMMLGALWAADMLQRLLRREVAPLRAAVAIAGGCVATVMVMWPAGYFMVGDGGVRIADPLMYRMNLLSPIDAVDWSALLPARAREAGDYEGFAYTGVGPLVLALIAGYLAIRRPRIPIDLKVIGPLLLALLCLALFAISPQIRLGHRHVWDYRLPGALQPLAEVFRARGRMIWPVYYAVYAAMFAVLFHRLRSRSAIILCAGLLVVQVADSWDKLARIRSGLSAAPAWVSPLRSPLWDEMGRHYRSISVVLPHGLQKDYSLALFAANHRLGINAGYFARFSPVVERRAQEQVRETIMTNRLDPLSLYVFEDDSLWRVAVEQVKAPDIVGILDDLRIVAPRLADCTGCSRSSLASLRPVKN